MVLMQFSDNEMLKRIFTEPVAMPSAGQKFKNNKFKGIIDTFRVQLAELVQRARRVGAALRALLQAQRRQGAPTVA